MTARPRRHPTHLRPRLESFRRDILRMLASYVVLVLVLQCLSALPQGYHLMRHTHITAAAAGLVVERFAPQAAKQHAHDGETHAHGYDSASMLPLGEQGDESSTAWLLALWAGAWPAAPLWPLTVGSETFARSGTVAFTSHSPRVPLQPPQRG